MAAAAITAPKSGGQLFLVGKPNFMETANADDPGTRQDLAAWMRARGSERRERIWFRDAGGAEAVDAILFVGRLPGWCPTTTAAPAAMPPAPSSSTTPKTLRSQSGELEFTGPVCNLRDIDPGVVRVTRRGHDARRAGLLDRAASDRRRRGRRVLNSSGTARADGSCGARPLPLAGPRSQGIG